LVNAAGRPAHAAALAAPVTWYYDEYVFADMPLAIGCLTSDASEMNQNPPATSVDNAATVESPVRRPLDVRALAAALAGIRTDSQREAEIYLRDTVVPHGGE